MNDKDKKENIQSVFSNQDPASGGYGEQEDPETDPLKTGRKIPATKAKKKKKNKTAKQSRKKNRR